MSKSGLKGVLKDINWWTSTLICPGKTFIQLVEEKRVKIKRESRVRKRNNPDKSEEKEPLPRVKKKRRIQQSTTESDELAPQSSIKTSVGGRNYKRLKLKTQICYKEKIKC